MSQQQSKKYRSQSEPLPAPTPINYGESKTIPDQAMSVREILHRYTTGQVLSVNNNTPMYAEDVPLYDTRRKHNIDLAVDRHNLEQEIQQIEQDVYEKIIEGKKLKASTAAKAAATNDIRQPDSTKQLSDGNTSS